MKYIDAEKLKTWLENEADIEFKKTEENANSPVLCHFHNGCRMQALDTIDFINSLQQEEKSVAERFARIVRGNLIGIDKEVQQKFEQLYFEVTGNKMYGGYND